MVLLAFSVVTPAQTDDWPPIPPADLALKDNPARPGAAAMLLDRNSQQDDIKGVESEYFRIKIFTEEGRRFANIEIPYFEKLDQVRDLRARTVRPDGTVLEFHGEILDKLIVKSKRLKYQAKVITLPEAEPGSIIEYAYKIAWHQQVPDVLKHPGGYLIFDSYSFPTVHWTLQQELFTRHARFSVRYLPKGNLQWALIRPPAGTAVQKQPDGTAELELHDIPPLEQEEFVPPENLINSRVHFFYVVGDSAPAWFWRGEARRQVEHIDKFIGHSKKIEQATASIVAASDAPEVKLRNIYARVQQLRYLSYEPRKSSAESKRENLKENKNVEEVWERGYAFANEINYLFVAMVRAAGLQAWVVRLTERSRSVLDKTVLDPTQLNATVVLVRLGSQDLYFDPATRFCPYGLLPWGETGVVGLQLGPIVGDFGSIPGGSPDTAITQRTANVKISLNGTLEGTLQVSFRGQEALRRRLESYDEDEAGRQKALEDEIKGWLPPGATVEIQKVDSWESSEDDLRVAGRFSVPDFANISGRRMLFPLTVFQPTRTNPFKSEKRTYPVYFAYAYQTEDHITWDFPAGVHAEAVPNPHGYQNNYFRYETKVTPATAGLKFDRSISLNGFIFDAGSYRMIKTAFEQMITNDNDQAVLQLEPPKQ